MGITLITIGGTFHHNQSNVKSSFNLNILTSIPILLIVIGIIILIMAILGYFEVPMVLEYAVVWVKIC